MTVTRLLIERCGYIESSEHKNPQIIAIWIARSLCSDEIRFSCPRRFSSPCSAALLHGRDDRTSRPRRDGAHGGATDSRQPYARSARTPNSLPTRHLLHKNPQLISCSSLCLDSDLRRRCPRPGRDGHAHLADGHAHAGEGHSVAVLPGLPAGCLHLHR